MNEIQDPFFEAKEHLTRKWLRSRSLHDLYLKMLKENGFKSSKELLDVSREFQETIDDIDDNLVDLEEVVRAVESQPQKYGISSDETFERRTFVDQVRIDIEQMQKDLDSPFTNISNGSDKPLKQSIWTEGELKRDSILNPQLTQQYQLLLMNEQDTQLDHVFGTVQNLREQASIMGRELEEQSELIEEVDMRVERMHEKIKRGFKNMKGIIKQNEDAVSSFCIAILIVILIVLLILIILF